MLHSDARLTASQQALLDVAHDIGLRTLDGASRLLDLNLRTARVTLAQTATRLKDAFEPLGDGDAGTIASRLSTPVVEQAAVYTRDACEIIAATHAEIVSVLGRQVQMPSVGAWFLVTPSVTAATRAVTTGSDMTETVEQIVQAVDVVVHAAEPNEPVAQPTSAGASSDDSDSAPIALVSTPATAPAASEAALTAAQPTAAEPDSVAVDSPTTVEDALSAAADAPSAELVVEAEKPSGAAASAAPASTRIDAVEAPAPMVELPLGNEPPVAPKAQQPMAQAVHETIDKAVRPASDRKAPAVARTARKPAESAKSAQPAGRTGGRATSRRSSTSS